MTRPAAPQAQGAAAPGAEGRLKSPALARSRPTLPDGGAQVLDFLQRRLERALRQRVRYRYVRPRVRREGEALRIESPCCSRNVDPTGGVIDIALLCPAPTRRRLAGSALRVWQLHARDHAAGAWVLALESARLAELFDALCTDPQRRFWP